MIFRAECAPCREGDTAHVFFQTDMTDMLQILLFFVEFCCISNIEVL